MAGAMASLTEGRMTLAVHYRGEATSARAASMWGRRSPATCTRRTAVHPRLTREGAPAAVRFGAEVVRADGRESDCHA